MWTCRRRLRAETESPRDEACGPERAFFSRCAPRVVLEGRARRSALDPPGHDGELALSRPGAAHPRGPRARAPPRDGRRRGPAHLRIPEQGLATRPGGGRGAAAPGL